MKRTALAIAVLCLAACGESPATPAAQQAARPDEWFAFGGDAVADYAAIRLHQTPAGLAGVLVRNDETAVTLRGIRRTGSGFSFTVPALGVAFNGIRTSEGWAGDWMTSAGTDHVQLNRADAPAAAGAVTAQIVKLPDNRRLHLVCAGEGSPVVLLDYGAGGTVKKDWGDIAALAAQAAGTKVCAYDRAGRGLSDPGPMPRDAAATAADMDAMLSSANLAPPYILVGHSLGSYHVRQYANTYPEKTGGLVLVDPSADGQLEKFNAVIPKVQAMQDEMFKQQAALNCVASLRQTFVTPEDPFAQQCGGNDPEALAATKSEVESMPAASTQQLVASRRAYGQMPLIVLTRTDYETDMPPTFNADDKAKMKQVWEGLHTEMAALSEKSQHRFVPGAGHYIQRDNPGAVVQAIADVVAQVRAAQP
jgi:pimeloyl-ACP methyl ester carboxylesterase